MLKVGSTPTGSPFTFLDTKTNSIEGVMVDIVKAVGKEAGFEVQIEPMAFSALIGSLTSKPVSYTHLDVYKRQAWCSGAAGCRRGRAARRAHPRAAAPPAGRPRRCKAPTTLYNQRFA